MKETINVNIGSQSFTLDYDAYQTLRTYLEDVESRMGADDKEVMNDIENRMAEIFREKTPSPMMVVTLATVRSAMAQMGRP
ncbi:MAG: PspC family transcriptional regulator, partial [Alistipes sp.]|nr:PspC family transcriptional regulator [Alistipes sp.]